MESCTILSDGNKLHGALATPTKTTLGVVFLHGGGHSNSTRFEYLQKRLDEKGVASLAFDMRGCGKSEGYFADSSLYNRKRDSIQAVNFFKEKTGLKSNQICLWGSSMGAHVAATISNELDVKSLILQAPAAYAKNAEKIPLNEEFTDALHRPNSWIDSQVFIELAKYHGKVLVVFGEHDKDIPVEVKKMYKESIKKDDLFVIITGGSHKLLSPSNNEESRALEELGNIAIKFII